MQGSMTQTLASNSMKPQIVMLRDQTAPMPMLTPTMGRTHRHRAQVNRKSPRANRRTDNSMALSSDGATWAGRESGLQLFRFLYGIPGPKGDSGHLKPPVRSSGTIRSAPWFRAPVARRKLPEIVCCTLRARSARSAAFLVAETVGSRLNRFPNMEGRMGNAKPVNRPETRPGAARIVRRNAGGEGLSGGQEPEWSQPYKCG